MRRSVVKIQNGEKLCHRKRQLGKKIRLVDWNNTFLASVQEGNTPPY